MLAGPLLSGRADCSASFAGQRPSSGYRTPPRSSAGAMLPFLMAAPPVHHASGRKLAEQHGHRSAFFRSSVFLAIPPLGIRSQLPIGCSQSTGKQAMDGALHPYAKRFRVGTTLINFLKNFNQIQLESTTKTGGSTSRRPIARSATEDSAKRCRSNRAPIAVYRIKRGRTRLNSRHYGWKIVSPSPMNELPQCRTVGFFLRFDGGAANSVMSENGEDPVSAINFPAICWVWRVSSRLRPSDGPMP